MTTRSPRRERTRQLKTETICAAAMKLIETRGLEGLTIGKLAKELDWAAGALYRYFPSKDALLAELQVRAVTEYAADRQATLEAARTAGLEGAALLMLVAKHYQRWFLHRLGYFGLLSVAIAYPKPILPESEGLRVMSEIMPTLQQIMGLFVEVESGGHLVAGNPSDRTIVFWSVIQGAVQMYKISRFAPELLNNDRVLREAVRTLLIGWGADFEAADDGIKQAEQWVKNR